MAPSRRLGRSGPKGLSRLWEGLPERVDKPGWCTASAELQEPRNMFLGWNMYSQEYSGFVLFNECVS